MEIILSGLRCRCCLTYWHLLALYYYFFYLFFVILFSFTCFILFHFFFFCGPPLLRLLLSCQIIYATAARREAQQISTIGVWMRERLSIELNNIRLHQVELCHTRLFSFQSVCLIFSVIVVVVTTVQVLHFQEWRWQAVWNGPVFCCFELWLNEWISPVSSFLILKNATRISNSIKLCRMLEMIPIEGINWIIWNFQFTGSLYNSS